MSAFTPQVRLRLDGQALAANWCSLARLSGNAATGAAVKANAYGLGAREVVARLSNAGCRDFFVAHWGEAEAIADIVTPGQIAVLNGVRHEDVRAVIALGAVPVLSTPHQIATWKAASGGRCHLMLDTGINRLGIGPEQMDPELFQGLEIDILASHLASADENNPQNASQLSHFIAMSAGIKANRKSLANSAGIMLGNGFHFELTRPGLALYGGMARDDMADHIAQVVYPEALILQTRLLKAGDTVGYNATFTCHDTMRVATAAIGYADGYARGLSGLGRFTHDGKLLPVIGRVSMDLVTLDISTAPEIVEGQWIDVQYELANISELSGRSQYELLTGLGTRSSRYWT
jgi:alanine racemase